MTTRPTYIIHLVPDHDDFDKSRQGLKWLVKRALKNYGLKCVYWAEASEDDADK